MKLVLATTSAETVVDSILGHRAFRPMELLSRERGRVYLMVVGIMLDVSRLSCEGLKQQLEEVHLRPLRRLEFELPIIVEVLRESVLCPRKIVLPSPTINPRFLPNPRVGTIKLVTRHLHRLS
jgi:hypothetical protein